MFHFSHPISQSPFLQRHHQQMSPSTHTSPSSLSFEEYDAHRSALEQQALLSRQRERRQTEEALYLKRARDAQIQQLLAERQAQEDHRQRLAYERTLREVMLREKVAREAKVQEELYLRKVLAMRERQQEQEQAEQQQDVFQQLHSFLQQSVRAQQSTPTPIPQPQPTVEAPETVHLTFQRAPPSPVPVQSSTSATSEQSDELKRHHESHLARRQTLAKLSTLSASLKSHQSTFSFPPTLIFSPSPPASQSDSHPSLESTVTPSPKLAYSSQNATFLAYEDFLVALLSKVDEIESKGDTLVKDARKELVRKIEQELSMLDQGKERMWVEYLEKKEAEVDDAISSLDNFAAAPTTESNEVQEKETAIAHAATSLSPVQESSSPATFAVDSTILPLDATSAIKVDDTSEDLSAPAQKAATPLPLVNPPLDSTSISSEPIAPSASIPQISPSTTKVVEESVLDAAIQTVTERALELKAEIERSDSREKELVTKERQGSAEEDFELV